jgi:hypothetical protein
MPQVLGGIGIVNPLVRHPGTIGLIAWRDGQPHIVSCYHVLCRLDGSPFVKDEGIYLTHDGSPQDLVAYVDGGLADLDVASARVAQDVGVVPGIVGLSGLSSPADPEEGMPVVKVGYATGKTEGTVARVDGFEVRIQGADGTAVSAGGDSGAVWVSRASWAPVALHTGTNDQGTIPYAVGIAMPHVLDVLALSFLDNS